MLIPVLMESKEKHYSQCTTVYYYYFNTSYYNTPVLFLVSVWEIINTIELAPATSSYQ